MLTPENPCTKSCLCMCLCCQLTLIPLRWNPRTRHLCINTEDIIQVAEKPYPAFSDLEGKVNNSDKKAGLTFRKK